ncbi:MAG: GlcNAc-transferase family protein [Janthinobacterium lividum]
MPPYNLAGKLLVMREADELIFVSIASYRDPQIVATIEDLFAKARYPARVRVGLCWQHGEEMLPAAFWADERLRIHDVPWHESRGACWARAEMMKLWQGETWFLQVDSHCRFKVGWDEYLVRTARGLASPKVVLSTYATAFVPGEREFLEEAPQQMALAGFTPEGIAHMKPLGMRNWQGLRQPRRARFLSAGFLFAPGSFVEEVPYDPELYFLGEEVTMTVRAFTSGYDLYHPAASVVWHDYVRQDAVKHWEDHTEEAKPGAAWSVQDLQSKARVAKLLAGGALQAFNLGTARTLAEYEAYAGISFKTRKAQDYTMRSEEPPNPPMDANWESEIYTWMVRIVVPAGAMSESARADASLWYLGIQDAAGNEIFRRDLTRAEVLALPSDQTENVLICEMQSGTIPAAWTVWPVTRGAGWQAKLQGELREEDYSILLEDGEDETREA